MCCGRLVPDTQNDFHVYGIDGRITGRTTVWEARQGTVEVVSETVNETQEFEYNYLANFIDEIQDFQHAIETGHEPAATGVDGLRVVQVTTALIQSAREGRAVKLQPVEA